MVQERPGGELKVLYTIARYFAAFTILFYGFAKLNGSQFTILGSELDKPMGQVSGFWLTWYYFGFSRTYGNLIAGAQILGGVLLTFRKTTLLGACLLLPILGNPPGQVEMPLEKVPGDPRAWKAAGWFPPAPPS